MRYLTATIGGAMLVLALGAAEAKAHPCPYTAMVESWYHQYLHRAPDPCGLQTWVSALKCGGNPLDVQASILASEEYLCAHGHSPAGFVTGLYADVLGRAPCAHDLENWLCRMRQLGCRKRVALEFLTATGPALVHRAARPVHVAPAPLGPRHFGGRPHVPVIPVPEVVPGVRRPLHHVPARGVNLHFSYRSR